VTKLLLTDRALSDIDAIEHYSVERWGTEVAEQYLADLDAALGRLAEDISLFKERHDYTGRLRFYNVREQVLVGDVIGGVGFVLTVWHGSMDFIDRLPNIEPDLVHEAEIMARQIDAERNAPEESA
jgi:plasmid stabilization system protein ParE